MCIHNTEVVKKKSGVGYKIFRVIGDGLHCEFFGSGNQQPRRWLRSDPNSHPDSYSDGWHIFLSVMAAHEWKGDDSLLVIRKVRYRKAFLIGAQGSNKVVVAKEIFILRGAK